MTSTQPKITVSELFELILEGIEVFLVSGSSGVSSIWLTEDDSVKIDHLYKQIGMLYRMWVSTVRSGMGHDVPTMAHHGARSPGWLYHEHVVEYLRSCGGSASIGDILNGIREKLSPGDFASLENHINQEPRFTLAVAMCLNAMEDSGLVERTGGEGQSLAVRLKEEL